MHPFHSLELCIHLVPLRLYIMGMSSKSEVNKKNRVIHYSMLRNNWKLLHFTICYPFITLHCSTRIDMGLDKEKQVFAEIQGLACYSLLFWGMVSW